MQPPYAPLPRSPSPVPPPLSPSTKIHLPLSPTTQFREDDNAGPSRRGSKSEDTSIPWRLMIPIMSFRVSDAMFFAVLFPIITDMVTSFNVPTAQIGFYAGLGEGVLMLVEAAFATPWAWLADRFGRKPCMIYGQLVAVGAAAMVGFSTKVWHIVFWRAMLGLGPCGVINKILASEISTPANRSKVFSVFSPSFSGGILFGAFVGGQLAHPYGRLPAFLGGENEFWRRWPYALPNIVVAVIGVFVCIAGQVYLVETRPPTGKQPHQGASHGLEEKRSHGGSVRDTLKVPGFVLVTVISCCFQLTNFAYDGIYSVYTYTAVDYGGLGLAVTSIGTIYSFGSLAYIILVPTLLPRLQARFGAKQLLSVVFAAWIILTLVIPLSQWTAKHARWAMWLVLMSQSLLKCFGAFAWPMCDILQVDTFDHFPELLANGSAISLMAGAIGRAVGPALSGWIYSMSTQFPTGSLGRQMSWLSMLTFTIPPILCVRMLRDRHTDKVEEGYETVPLAEAGDFGDEDEVGHMGHRVRVTAVEV